MLEKRFASISKSHVMSLRNELNATKKVQTPLMDIFKRSNSFVINKL